MKSESPASLRNMVRYSLLASVATMLQMSAVLFPGPGRILAAFNTLPIALAAYIGPRGGFFCYLVSAWLAMTIMPAEMPVLVLCTAPLGLVLGWGVHYSLKDPVVILAGTITFAAGMALMTLLLGIPAFGPLFAGKKFPVMFGFYTSFALAYSWAWLGLVKKIIRQMSKVGLDL